MGLLRISLFGQVEITHTELPSRVKATRVSQGLLGYLLLNRHRSHPRETLAGLFWADSSPERARSCLSTALWRLRQALEPEGIQRGTYLLTGSAGEVGFNWESSHWLDVASFEGQVGQALAKPAQTMDATDVQALKGAMQLYTGDLLEGFYDEWALRERERLRLLHLNSLAHLMHYYQHQGAFEESLACGQKILGHDPLREEIHRDMMRLYLENGQRALAVRQYEVCSEILAAELGIPPMEETQALFSQITAGASQPWEPSSPSEESICCQRALQRLQLALQTFDEARKELKQAIGLIEGFIER